MAWKKIPDGGWLQDEPAYESPSGKYIAARDYDAEDTAKLMWFLHDDEHGFIAAFDTLKECKERAGE